MLCMANQDGQVIVECSDKTSSLGEDIVCQNNFNILAMRPHKIQRDMTQKVEPPGFKSVQYSSGAKWRVITKSSGRNEVVIQKQK